VYRLPELTVKMHWLNSMCKMICYTKATFTQAKLKKAAQEENIA
jgi:hypothetical protein